MTTIPELPNERSGSTRWEYKRVMIRPGAATANTAGRNGRPSRQLARRNPRKPLSVTLKWRGGAEGWIEVESRGGKWRVPGWTPVADLVLRLNDTVRVYPGEDK